MVCHKPRWLCAHFLTLLAVLVVGTGLMDVRPAWANEPNESVVPESGGGGGLGDPDQPQDPKSAPGGDPGFAPGGDPEYTAYNPIETETTGSTGFGGRAAIGRNSINVWKWRVRFMIAGLRFSYLRF